RRLPVRLLTRTKTGQPKTSLEEVARKQAMTDTQLLSWIIFLPALGALFLSLPFIRSDGMMKWFSLLVVGIDCFLCFMLLGQFLGMMEMEGGLGTLYDRAMATVGQTIGDQNPSD